ncbi:hypothetical protein [Streptosporangium lutulentum]|uniref:Uncharacterized protein n=1 Tax=Streptosporangium lutulentum TaxID=1461250 RepID=A0ABT9QAC4_9ACTN|nr:hypothetical protein [Streptosporangium lutulentum]MDP9843691.1 hypothetical protein [Streptosporangium lutulentum]
MGDDRRDDPPADGHLHPHLARHLNAHTFDPGTWLLDRIDAREQVLTSQIEQTQAQIEELTGRLRDLDQDLDHAFPMIT